MFMRKEKESSENEVFPDVTLEDMDEESFKIMRSHISIHNSNHPWLSMTNEEFLKSLFWGKQRGTNKEGYKLAAILLFGKEQTILNCCPWHRTDAIYRSMSYERFLHPLPTDPDIRYNDRDMICANLIQSYIRLLNFVQRNMPDKFRLADNGIDRLDLRVMIFREVISNTLLHREYISSYTNKFLIFRDRVITENWTKPFSFSMRNAISLVAKFCQGYAISKHKMRKNCSCALHWHCFHPSLRKKDENMEKRFSIEELTPILVAASLCDIQTEPPNRQ